MIRMKSVAWAVFLLILLAGGQESWGQAGEDPEKYPSRPITLTGSFAAGGSTDLTCRAIAKVAEKYIKQPIVAVPKPGGAGLIALQNLASSKPDGYTLHLGRPADYSIGPFIEKLPFDVVKTFIPVAQVTQDRNAFSVFAGSPWKTIEELVAAAKAEPGKIRYAVANPTTCARMSLEKFCYDAGIKLTIVPFQGSAPATIAVAGGHIPVSTATVGEVLPHYRSGKMRILLVCSDRRNRDLPDVPTSQEKGYSGVNFGNWCTVFARIDTPKPILMKIESIMKKVAEDEEFVKTMAMMASEAGFVGMDGFAKYWEGERPLMAELVRRTGLDKK